MSIVQSVHLDTSEETSLGAGLWRTCCTCHGDGVIYSSRRCYFARVLASSILPEASPGRGPETPSGKRLFDYGLERVSVFYSADGFTTADRDLRMKKKTEEVVFVRPITTNGMGHKRTQKTKTANSDNGGGSP